MKNTIKSALVTIPYTGEYLEGITKALAPAKVYHIPDGNEAAISEALKEVDVAILASDISPQILNEGKNLRWIHCNHAGLALSARPEVFEKNILLTGASGRSSPVLSEHAFFLLLSLVYRSHVLTENKNNHVWDWGMYADRRGLYEKTMGIIGLGYIGQEVAKRAEAFNMKVIAYDKYNPNAKSSLDDLLKESDVVVIAVRLNDETYHMIDKKALSTMKPSAFLINMARGAVVDERDLYEALKNNTIAGYGSDVFETEPLPSDSVLWDLPNIVITPHCTPEMPDMKANCVKIIVENIHNYREGLPMRNKLDLRDVYTKER